MSLKFVVVMPCASGKTTLRSSDAGKETSSFFLDVDELYSLTETETTYARMNQQILELLSSRADLPDTTARALRARIEEYCGPARCLLVQSLAVANVSKLDIRGIWLPSLSLHSYAMNSRSELSRWIAVRNRDVVLAQGRAQKSEMVKIYNDWNGLNQLVTDLRQCVVDEVGCNHEDRVNDNMLGASVIEQPAVNFSTQRACTVTNEEQLIHLVASGLGCKFAI